MTTAVAPAPTMAALAPPSLSSEAPRSFHPIAPSASAQSTTPESRRDRLSNGHSPASNEPSPPQRTSPEGRGSPTSSRAAQAPKVIVKKEPASPEMATSRHRPRRLDLSKGANGHAATTGNGRPSAPLTSKESAGLAIQDLGLQCLSPGFHTQDPTMREQLQRSMNVREQQRQLIEARQKGKVTASTPPEHLGEPGSLSRVGKPLGTSRRKGPPPGLSIAAPSAAHFQDERVIQSAPLGQSFTGLNRNIHPATRHIVNQPTSLSNTSHIHHQPAVQTSNRLPPIADVFAGDSFANGPQSSRASHFPHNDSPSHSGQHPPARSPGFPPPHQQPQPQQATYPPPSSSSHPQYPHTAHPSSRPREYRSAEEALTQITGGREDLLPRIVHYGGHQPPTPPSPMPTGKTGSGGLRDHLAVQSTGSNSGSGSSADAAAAALGNARSASGRRRDRDEYERDLSPRTQQQHQQEQQRRRREAEAMWTDGRWERDSPETRQRKKERFISLCSEAWDLFHS